MVQLPKLAKDSVHDVEWLPTHHISIPEVNNEDETETIAASEISVLDNLENLDDLDTKLDDDQYSVISVSSDLGSVTSMSSIEFSEVKPFVSSDEGTLIGSDLDLDHEIDSNLDTDTDEGSQDVNMSSEPESESDMDFLPNNVLEIIQKFQNYQTLPEVIHKLIIFPQNSSKFQFLYQLDPSICTWNHTCLC